MFDEYQKMLAERQSERRYVDGGGSAYAPAAIEMLVNTVGVSPSDLEKVPRRDIIETNRRVTITSCSLNKN